MRTLSFLPRIDFLVPGCCVQMGKFHLSCGSWHKPPTDAVCALRVTGTRPTSRNKSYAGKKWIRNINITQYVWGRCAAGGMAFFTVTARCILGTLLGWHHVGDSIQYIEFIIYKAGLTPAEYSRDFKITDKVQKSKWNLKRCAEVVACSRAT